MSDNPTRRTPDARSFEERVFARFDALDARFSSLEEKVDGLDTRFTALEGEVGGMNTRMGALEEKADARLRETRPIWEAVQADLEHIKGEVKDINRNIKVLHKDVVRVRVEHEELRERIEKLESEPTR